MNDPIAYLPPEVVDTLRHLLRELDSDDAWKITRVAERAWCLGYSTSYMRGYNDGYARARADLKADAVPVSEDAGGER